MFLLLYLISFQPAMADENASASPDTKPSAEASANTVVIGMISPETGSYSKEGLAQRRAANMALEEINTAGGIMGRKVQIKYQDSRSNPRTAKAAALELFEKENAQMIFGGVSSPVALAVGKVAKAKLKLFFGTLAYSPDLTVEEGHKFIFRECYDSRMAVKALSEHLKKNYAGKKYFYVTTDDNWGWITEEIFRQFTDTTDKEEHKGFLIQSGSEDYKYILKQAQDAATVLVLILFGQDLSLAMEQAQDMEIKKHMSIVVPSMTVDMAESAGAEAMEGILSTTPWCWKLPFDEHYPKGIEFVKKFEQKFERYPSSSAASAYVILYQYKEAVERAKTFDTLDVIKALENHKYIGLKDEQQWRAFDHQSLQTVYAVRLKKADQVNRDKHKMDYFEVINKIDPQTAALTAEEWIAARKAIGTSQELD